MGCDLLEQRDALLNTYFNPRTHRGVRPCEPLIPDIDIAISIHAPIVGCDHTTINNIIIGRLFQSTHPSWGATKKYLTMKQIVRFQSTHPSWGATLCGYAKKFDSLISIHAPIVGCDTRDKLCNI